MKIISYPWLNEQIKLSSLMAKKNYTRTVHQAPVLALVCCGDWKPGRQCCNMTSTRILRVVRVESDELKVLIPRHAAWLTELNGSPLRELSCSQLCNWNTLGVHVFRLTIDIRKCWSIGWRMACVVNAMLLRSTRAVRIGWINSSSAKRIGFHAWRTWITWIFFLGVC